MIGILGVSIESIRNNLLVFAFVLGSLGQVQRSRSLCWIECY